MRFVMVLLDGDDGYVGKCNMLKLISHSSSPIVRNPPHNNHHPHHHHQHQVCLTLLFKFSSQTEPLLTRIAHVFLFSLF